MKTNNIFIVALLLLSLSVMNGYAQYGYGSYGYGDYSYGPYSRTRSPMAGGAAMSSGPEAGSKDKKVDLVSVTGLFIIDIKPIVEKCKISKKATIDKITDFVVEYQEEQDKLSFEFTMEIDQIFDLQYMIEDDEEGTNQAQIQAKMGSVRETMRTINRRTMPIHKKLLENINSILSEKELKRWSAYYRRLCDERSFVYMPEGAPEDAPERDPEGAPDGM